jgi:hypothetical protein
MIKSTKKSTKILMSLKIAPWIVAACDIIRERDPPPTVGGKRATSFPDLTSEFGIPTRTWVVDTLLRRWVEKHGLREDSPEVIEALKGKHLGYKVRGFS